MRNITYKISKYPRLAKMSPEEIDSEIRKAWQVWSSVTDLSFEQRRSGKVHVDIRFEDGEHGDGDNFDGLGGTLAHAFFPVYGGDVHFDNSEHWTMKSLSGTNLAQTAVLREVLLSVNKLKPPPQAHEFGHSLGLSHSKEYKALMAPFYRGYQSRVSLAQDDITAVQTLYGKKTIKTDNEIGTRIAAPSPSPSPPPPPPPPPTPSPEDDLCQNSTIDSMITMPDGTFAFKGEKYWKLTDDAVAEGYPKTIADNWVGLPGNQDYSIIN